MYDYDLRLRLTVRWYDWLFNTYDRRYGWSQRPYKYPKPRVVAGRRFGKRLEMLGVRLGMLQHHVTVHPEL